VSDTAPANGGTANLSFAGSIRLTPVTDANWSILSLGFASGAGAFTLSGNTLTIGSGGVSNTSASLQTVSNNITLSANQSWTAVGGNLRFSGLISLNSFAWTLNPSSGRIITVSNAVSGAGSLLKAGAGTLALTGTNTFAGGVALSAGVLSINSGAALGSGTLSLSGGTLTTTAVSTITNNVTASGTVIFSGQNQTFSGGTFTLTANTTLNAAIALTLANGLAESGGSRSLTKTGSGILTINNSLSTTGNVAINAGTLALGPGVTLPPSNLAFGGGVLAASGSITRNLGTGAGQLRFTGSGGFAAYGGNLSISGITGVPV
jgi:autotransporter-associated beta strand protein